MVDDRTQMAALFAAKLDALTTEIDRLWETLRANTS
jgi:hypothetical protein